MTVPPFRPDAASEASDEVPVRRPAEPPILGPVGPGHAPPSGASTSGTVDLPAEGSRFRRPERSPFDAASRDSGTDRRPDDFNDPDGVVDVIDSRALSVSRDGGVPGLHGVSEPLAALAAAFQANAEALRRSHELQADLGRALQRADRSEAMVQNTAALNDTFKGLTQVQRSLIHSVDEADRATRVHRWFLPTLVLASLVVVGAGLWLVVTRMNEIETDVIGRGDVGTQLNAARREGEAVAREGLAASYETERRAFDARMKDRDDELQALKADASTRDAKTKQLEVDLNAASQEIQGARNDTLRARALEAELNQLRVDAAIKGPEAERLRLELEAEKRTVADLRRRLADVGLGRVPSNDGSQTPFAEAVPKESTVPTPRDDAEPMTDRRALEMARTRLNELLEAAASGRTDHLQVTALGSVAGTRVEGATVVRYGAAGKVMSTYKAKDLKITVDRTRRIVEFAFSDGTLDYAGSRVPFPGGALTVVVAEGDQITTWLRSGLTFIGSR